MRPYRCPVCEGRGTVPAGFYSSGGMTASLNPERCMACHGQGIVWGLEYNGTVTISSSNGPAVART